jgi:hypothetical protein
MTTRKTIRTLTIYETSIRKLGQFRIVHPLPKGAEEIMAIGFATMPIEGDSVLPSSVGKISDFNANGRLIVRKDLPKVPDSRMGWRTWNDWHGNPHSGIQIRTIDIYPRERVLPLSEYLTVLRGATGLMLCSRPLALSCDTEETIVHVLNLYLELFGEFQVVSLNLENSSSVQVRRLNWKILPPGPYPFARAKQELSEFINTLPDDVRPEIEDRIKAITQHSPDFIATGLGGFKDYVVYGFTESGKYVFESPALGNATYIFKSDWMELSLMSKKQILDGSLHEERIIHNKRWRNGIREAIAG